MTTTRLRAAAALTFAFIAASCGGGDGGTGPTFPDSISTVDAQDFASGVQSYATYVAQGLNFNGPSIALAAPMLYARAMARPEMAQALVSSRKLPAPDFSLLNARAGLARVRGLQASAAEGCNYSGHGSTGFGFDGDPVDVNQNGIPDDLLIRIECTVTDSTNPDTVVTEYQLEEIAISEIQGSLWGMRVHERMHFRESASTGQFIDQDVTAGGNTDIQSGGATDAADLVVKISNRSDSVTHVQTFGQGYNNSFDPTGTIVLGNDLPDGALTIGGRQYYTDTDASNASFGIQTTTPLAYSAACALANTDPPFTAGVLRGLLNNNTNSASFTITFTSCGNATIDVSGTHDPSVVAVVR